MCECVCFCLFVCVCVFVFHLRFVYVQIISFENMLLLVFNLFQRLQTVKADKAVAFGATGLLIKNDVSVDNTPEFLEVSS